MKVARSRLLPVRPVSEVTSVHVVLAEGSFRSTDLSLCWDVPDVHGTAPGSVCTAQ